MQLNSAAAIYFRTFYQKTDSLIFLNNLISKMKKPHTLLLLCIFLMMDMTTFSFLAPILPDLMLSRDMSLSLVGFIFSFYPLSYFIVSLYLGKNLYLFDKKKLLAYCQLLLVLSNIAFGTLDLVSSNTILVILSVLSRLIQGMAIGGACSILYAYIPELYPYEQEETFAIIEMSVGAGISIGPILGGYFYQFLKYELSFFIIAGIYGISSLLFLVVIKFDKHEQMIDSSILNSPLNLPTPSSRRISLRESLLMTASIDIDPRLEEDEKDITYVRIFKNKIFLMTFLMYCICYTSITLIQPTFSEHIHSFGYDSDTVGLLFALSDLSYALTSIALIKIFRNFKRKHLFVFGGFLTAISLFLLGPEEYTFLPKNVYVICFGMVIFGISQVFYNATIIPEFIDILIDIYGYRKEINDRSSGIYNAGLALSEFCGPLLGGIMTDLIGFERGLSFYSIFLIFYLTIYAIFIKRPPRTEKELENPENPETPANLTILY